jgi:hypothetical protein
MGGRLSICRSSATGEADVKNKRMNIQAEPQTNINKNFDCPHYSPNLFSFVYGLFTNKIDVDLKLIEFILFMVEGLFFLSIAFVFFVIGLLMFAFVSELIQHPSFLLLLEDIPLFLLLAIVAAVEGKFVQEHFKEKLTEEEGTDYLG